MGTECLKVKNADVAFIIVGDGDEEKLKDVLEKDRLFTECKTLDKNWIQTVHLGIVMYSGLKDKGSAKIERERKKLRSYIEYVRDILDGRTVPIILVVDEIRAELINNLTAVMDEYYEIAGIFRKRNLLPEEQEEQYDLEDVGNLVRVIKSVLREKIPEIIDISEKEDPGDNFVIKKVNWKITLEDRNQARSIITLFLDEPMRMFLKKLYAHLEKMRDAYKPVIEPITKVKSEIKDWEGILVKWLEHEMGLDTGINENEVNDENIAFKYERITKLFEPGNKKIQPLHILLEGETGTGKSMLRYLIARFLGLDEKRDVAFVNASTFAENLLVGELFGTLQGHYTDALTRPGVFMKKVGALVFIDEIGEIGEGIQAKLLQYMEDFMLSPEGAFDRQFFAPVYFVAATNKNLYQLVREGKFREDLYHRFRIRLRVPSLKERKSDLKTVISFLLQTPGINPKMKVKYITYKAIQRLLSHDYTQGNFRELEKILQEAVQSATREGSDVLKESHILEALYEIYR